LPRNASVFTCIHPDLKNFPGEKPQTPAVRRGRKGEWRGNEGEGEANNGFLRTSRGGERNKKLDESPKGKERGKEGKGRRGPADLAAKSLRVIDTPVCL